MAGGWKRLGHTQNAGVDSNIIVDNIPVADYLKVQITFGGVSASSACRIRFNDDATSNIYRYRNYNNGGMDTGSANAWNPQNHNGTDNDSWILFDIFIDNHSGKYKLCESICTFQSSAGAGTYPIVTQNWCKWANTDQISKIDVTNDLTQDMQALSSVTVWGAVDGTTTYPYLSNGAIFEESDTGKHYMFDGTSTWNEIT